MKRLTVLLVILVFFAGCTGLQLTETQEYTVKKVARLAGIYLGLERPDDVDKALAYCDYLTGLESGKLKEAALKVALDYIKKEYGQSLKAALLIGEVSDLITYAVPNDMGLTIDVEKLDMAVKSFKEGLALTVQ